MSFLKKLIGNLGAKVSPDDALRSHLLSHGDDGTIPRVVDHFAYFMSLETMQEFVDYVTSKGYVVTSASEPDFVVQFERETAIAVSGFDAELAVLREKALSLGGEYDGWESPIAK